MDDSLLSQASDHVRRLLRLSAQLRAGSGPAGAQIERALEGGFGCLVSLEARLERQQKPPGEKSPRPVGETDLRESIERLSAALSELRTLSSPHSPPRIGYGFVLPLPPVVRRPPLASG